MSEVECIAVVRRDDWGTPRPPRGHEFTMGIKMSTEPPAASPKDLLLAQIRESYGKVVYTHKKHEKQADLCFRNHRLQRGGLVALTAVSSGTFLAALLNLVWDQQGAALVTSFIALLVTALNLGTKTFKYGEEAQRHRDVASRLRLERRRQHARKRAGRRSSSPWRTYGPSAAPFITPRAPRNDNRRQKSGGDSRF